MDAFHDKSRTPTDADVEAALGPSIGLWGALKARLALQFDPLQATWSWAGKSHGWSLRLAHRDRAILYLAPLDRRFRASLALPERAMPAALRADLPGPLREALAGAPTYPEGRAIRIEVAAERDVDSVITLARIRMAS